MYFVLQGADFSQANLGQIEIELGSIGTGGTIDPNAKYTLTVNVNVEGATIKLTPEGGSTITTNGTSGTIEVTYNTKVNIEVSKEDYNSYNRELTITRDRELSVTLTPIASTTQYTLTITPNPSDATVTLNNSVRNSITVNANTEVNWSVEKENYVSQSGKWIATKNEELNITLVEEDSGESGEPETPVDPPSDNPTTPNTITWELGAINSGGGPNSTDMPTQRIRTAGYLQVESSITIKATGNVEFCPVYYRADKTYISSPNKYQTTDCVVNASQYPLVRLMIRDKTSTSANLTSKLTELGNSIVITGNFVEIPYDGTSGGGSSGTTGATGIGEGATWQSGAIDSNSGNGSVKMASRIHTGFIPLGNVTVSVSGDAEFCPFLYRADKTYIKPSTTPTYQKTTQTWTSADGAYLVLMARNSTSTSATIDPSYGANVNIQTN